MAFHIINNQYRLPITFEIFYGYTQGVIRHFFSCYWKIQLKGCAIFSSRYIYIAFVILYNIPSAVHAVVEPETLFELSKHNNIIGVKDSYGDMARFQHLLRLCAQGDFAIFQGTQRVAGLSLLAGADGLVPGLGNLAPSWFAEMIEAARHQQVDKVLEIQARIVRLWTLQTCSSHWLSCLKAAANLLGLCGPTTSAPLPVLGDEEVARVKDVLEQTGLM